MDGVKDQCSSNQSKTSGIGATNPEYQGNGMLEGYPTVAGSVGETHNASVTFRGSDGLALIRATA